jgi:hypothetical protein
MHQGEFLNEELRCRQGGKRRAQFEIALTGITGSHTLFVFFAFDLEIAEEGVVPSGAEGTHETIHLP